jgi:hypothetical protein
MVTRKRIDADNPYRSMLDAEGKALYDALSSETDVAQEIRLLRVICAKLLQDGHIHGLGQMILVLLRAIYIQARSNSGSAGDLEAAIVEAANLALDRSELDAYGG